MDIIDLAVFKLEELLADRHILLSDPEPELNQKSKSSGDNTRMVLGLMLVLVKNLKMGA
jgi:hypothetical protein